MLSGLRHISRIALIALLTWPSPLRAQPSEATGLATRAEEAARKDPVRAMRLYRQAFLADPSQTPVYEALWALAERTELPRDATAEAELAASFGETFKTHITPHFILVHDTEAVWTENRAQLLEHAHDQFFQAFRAQNLQPLPLTERLVCLLFNEYTDYVHYGQRTDRQNVGGFNGYFSGRTNRIAYYNDKTGPEYARYVQHVENLKKQLPGFVAQLRQARGHADRLRQIRFQMNQIKREMAWYQTRINAYARKGNTATTIHEAVHQLSYNCGIQARGVNYPFWFSEGLATSFESSDDLRDFGPGQDNLNRRKQLVEARRQNRLLPLQILLTLNGPKPVGPVTVLDEYAQSWGLFRHLYNHRQKQLLAYLQEMRRRPPGALSPEVQLEVFESSFGPVTAVEADWQQHLKTLR